MRALLLCVLACCAAARDLPEIVFIEPVGKLDTNKSDIREKMPLYRLVADPAKYRPWLRNECAVRALRLYNSAARIVEPGASVRAYYIALAPGGNHAAVGFRLQSGEGIRAYPHTAYILLDAAPERFETTLLHETGHVAMDMLAGGRQLDGREAASIPHSTAALSDRTTAFSEGYAIHLETLAAHLAQAADLRRRYHHHSVVFGDAPYRESEYYRGAADLTTYSQDQARYFDVRENHFAFESAFQGPDYLRVQLERARDFATVRNANQLLQSEGFYASFFFLFVMRGGHIPAEEVIAQREERIERALAAMFTRVRTDISTPWLLELATEYMRLFPEERTGLVDALNDLSHGVFVDPAATALWRLHYLASLRLDFARLNRDAINAARERWREQVLADPRVLYSRIGPEIVCEAPDIRIRLAAFEEDAPLRFDVNTVQEGVLRMILGITEPEIARWVEERSHAPFAGPEDFRKRAGLNALVQSRLKL